MNVNFNPNIGQKAQTGSVIGPLKQGADVAAQVFYEFIGSDAVEAGSSNKQIMATAHAAVKGDLIEITSGTLIYFKTTVLSVLVNAINLADPLPMPLTLAPGDTFSIYRPRVPRMDNTGAIFVNTGSAAADPTVLEVRYHDAASTNINDVAGAFVELGTPATALVNDILRLQISLTLGEVLQFRVAANAGAALAAPDKFIVNRGEGPTTLDCTFTTGDRIWVRSLTTLPVTDGWITVNLIG